MTKKQSKATSGKKKKIQSKKEEMEAQVQIEEPVEEQEEDKESDSVEEEAPKAEDKSDKEDKSDHEESDEIAKQIESLQASANDWKDKYMRLSAEFDNYRKRTLKEKSDMVRVANEDLLKDILPVVDDLERGMVNMDKSEDVHALREGVHLIHSKFSSFLKQKGIKEIEATEKDFDLDYHEAVTKIPAPKEELKGKVVDVIEKGYTLNDKVIRYAKVVVGE